MAGRTRKMRLLPILATAVTAFSLLHGSVVGFVPHPVPHPAWQRQVRTGGVCVSTATTRISMIPEPLAKEGDWTAYLDEESTGLVYYFNMVTGESRWEAPTQTFPTVVLSRGKRRKADKKRAEYIRATQAQQQQEEKKGFLSSLLDTDTEEEELQQQQAPVEEGGPEWFSFFKEEQELREEREKAQKEEKKKEEKTADLFSSFFEEKAGTIQVEDIPPATDEAVVDGEEVLSAVEEEEKVEKKEQQQRSIMDILFSPDTDTVEADKKGATESPEPAPVEPIERVTREPGKTFFDSFFPSTTDGVEEPPEKVVPEVEKEKEQPIPEKKVPPERKVAPEKKKEAPPEKKKPAPVTAQKATAAPARKRVEPKKKEAPPKKKKAEPKRKVPITIEPVVVEEEVVTPIKIEMGQKVLPHPDKKSWGGEDAVFIKGRTFGVFDGVTNAAKRDGIPLYSKMLASEMRRNVGVAGLGVPDLTQLLTNACAVADAKATGATTAIIGSIGEDGYLRVLNVGDSTAILVRDGRVVKKTKEINHFFECPYQLSEESQDRPRDGTRLNIELVRGDTIIMGSDGVFDNLSDDKILDVLSKSPQRAATIANRVATESWRVSRDGKAETPYAKLAQRNRDKEYADGVGGKLDDVSCVVVRYT